MTKSKMPTVREVMKSEYSKATKSVLSAKTRLRNAVAKKRVISKAMKELGYDTND